MTVAAGTGRSSIWTADGENRNWDFPFKVLSASHVKLAVWDASGNLSLVSDGFAVDGINSDDGGTVAYPVSPAAALPAGSKIQVRLAVPFTQPNRIGNQGGFHAETHERTFDLLAMQTRQIFEEGTARGITAPFEDGDLDMSLPDKAARVGRALMFNDAGEPEAGPNLAEIASAAENAAIAQQAAEIVQNAPAFSADLANVTQTGAGAVARSVSDKLKDVFHAADFGILPDGGDHRTKIAAAVNALPSGGTLQFGPGVYTFPNKVADITGKNNITIRGAGKGATIFRSTVPAGIPAFGDAVFFFFNGCTRLTIRDITFDLNSILTTNTNTSAVAIVNGSHNSFIDNEIINGTRLGLGLNGEVEFRVERNYFHKAGAAIGTYQNEAILCSVSGGISGPGHVLNNRMAGWGTLFSGRDIVVSGNVISGWAYGAGITINIDSSTFRPVIRGNVLRDSSGRDVNNTSPSGIECWAAQAMIEGNICTNNASAGICFAGEGSVVNGNICYNNGNYDSNGVGIALVWQAGTAPAQRCVVANNVCYDTGTNYQKSSYGETNAAGATFNHISLINNHFATGLAADVKISPLSTNVHWEGFMSEGASSATTLTVAAGASNTSVSISVLGATMGDFVEASCDKTLSGCTLTGYVHNTNQVFVTITNLTGAAVTLTSAVFRARVRQKRP